MYSKHWLLILFLLYCGKYNFYRCIDLTLIVIKKLIADWLQETLIYLKKIGFFYSKNAQFASWVKSQSNYSETERYIFTCVCRTRFWTFHLLQRLVCKMRNVKFYLKLYEHYIIPFLSLLVNDSMHLCRTHQCVKSKSIILKAGLCAAASTRPLCGRCESAGRNGCHFLTWDRSQL